MVPLAKNLGLLSTSMLAPVNPVLRTVGTAAAMVHAGRDRLLEKMQMSTIFEAIGYPGDDPECPLVLRRAGEGGFSVFWFQMTANGQLSPGWLGN